MTHSQESRNLDLLRAVAVLFVFGAHLILTLTPGHHVYDAVHTPWVALLYTLGNIGVLLFFVHTSLVLMLSLERTRQPSLFVNFYIRRFFRIYPLSIFCILIVLLLRIPWVPELAFKQPGWRDVMSNLLLVQNLTHANDIISPLWTLPLEVQMYAVLPLIFVLVRWKGSVPMILILWGIAATVAPFYTLRESLCTVLPGWRTRLPDIPRNNISRARPSLAGVDALASRNPSLVRSELRPQRLDGGLRPVHDRRSPDSQL